MNREDIIAIAQEAGITPWVNHQWVGGNEFVHTDEGMDGDLACLMQFAALVANAEREACAQIAQAYEPRCDACPSGVSDAIRARGKSPLVTPRGSMGEEV